MKNTNTAIFRWNTNNSLEFNSKSWISLLILFIVGVLSAIWINGCVAVQNNQLKPLRVGMNRWPGFDVALYAEEAGIFEKRGLEVELVQFDNAQDGARAMLRGALDAAFVPMWDVMQVDPGNDKPVFVMVTNISHGSDGIVTKSGIKSVKGSPWQKGRSKARYSQPPHPVGSSEIEPGSILRMCRLKTSPMKQRWNA